MKTPTAFVYNAFIEEKKINQKFLTVVLVNTW